MYNKFLKRFFDIVFSGIMILLLIPVWIVLVIAIKIDSKGPVIFKQKRMGIHKKPFYILKFRTMRIDAPKDVPTHLFKDAERYMTKFQRFLRRSSLDELPQLFNIFVGQMSIIGPRPALWNLYELLDERDKYGANDVKPGLTGWAQVNGRDGITNPEKAKLDGEYVKKLSFWFDCKCFFRTIRSVLRRDGVIEGGVDDKKDEETPLQKEQK